MYVTIDTITNALFNYKCRPGNTARIAHGFVVDARMPTYQDYIPDGGGL